MKPNLLDEILDDLEKEELQRFWDNEVQREAVRKVLLAGIYHNGTLPKGKKVNPMINFALAFVSNRGELSNEQIGEQLRASWEGINALEIAFSNLSKFKFDIPNEKVVNNPAR